MRPLKLHHIPEGLAAQAFYWLFRALPIGVASWLCGSLCRLIGPRLAASRGGRRNLELVFPGKPAQWREDVLKDCWENFGRLIGEFPHLQEIRPGGRLEVVGSEHIHTLRDAGNPAIFASGHLGNWEILSQLAWQEGSPLTMIYRPANNRLVDWLFTRARRHMYRAMLPKGLAGTRHLVQAVRRGEQLGMLIDQKMNDGEPVPLFGHPAMTSPAVAQLAIRYRVPIVMARCQRLKGAHFRIIIDPPYQPPLTGDFDADATACLNYLHRRLEAWILDDPGQWFWLHRRWDKALYRRTDT